MAKSNILLLAAVVVAVLVLVVGGFMVGREMTTLGQNQKKLKAQGGKVGTFYQADPYPSPGNVAIQNQNVERVQQKLDEMMAALGNSNFTVPEGSAAGFVDRLEKLRKELLKMAQTSGTRVPDAFAFGFERWADGASLPKASQLAELNRQLSIATTVCSILFEEGSLELAKVIREEVAEPVDAPVEGEESVSEEGIPDEMVTKRFERIRFTLEFVAREESFVRILNRFAADPMFLVVSSVAMTKDVPDVRMPAPAASSDDDDGGGATTDVDLTERVMVSGPSVDGGMRLTLVVDAYHFPGATPTPTSSEAVAPATDDEESQ